MRITKMEALVALGIVAGGLLLGLVLAGDRQADKVVLGAEQRTEQRAVEEPAAERGSAEVAPDGAPERKGLPPEAALGRTLRAQYGDYSELVERKHLRVLVPHAPPQFFFERGQPRGVTYEVFEQYGRFVEQREGLRSGDLTIVYVPCELELVIPWLTEGYGDIAASALTVTDARAEQVAFTAPLVEGVKEVLVTGPGAPSLDSLDDLAGREVWATAGSSYVEHLAALSAELAGRGLEPIAVRVAPGTLSTEDLLEMTHAGIFDLAVCDDYKARLWTELLEDLQLREDLVVHAGGDLAWAVRPESRELLESLNAFVGEARKGTLLGNVLIKRYFGSTRWIEDPTGDARAAEIERYAAWMQSLGAEYGFDWVRLAAQCFQESGLDPSATSPSGALGLMQLLPSTGADMGCDDLLDPEQNLRAGVRYLDWLRTHFFADPDLDEVERMDFILAAYNAGPGNVRKWRKLAPERGLDPDRWRDHVERLALEHVGIQPLRYVDNIEKFHVAYSLALELSEARSRERGAED